jgi:uncharacterized membrane protein YdjX (TVP38/TMEM64 family)
MSPKKARKIPWKAIGLGLGVLFLFVAARLLPVADWLRDFNAWVKGLGPEGMVLYGLVYVIAAVLFVPGLVLTLGAGFAFGLLRGVIVVSLASTVAAALAFLIARHLARDRIEKLARKNEKFEAIDRAIGQKGWKIVALLRLSPLVPFSLSNYLYGLTAVKFVPYVLASWIAMLPATVLYVYLAAAGKAAAAAAVGGAEKATRSPWEYVLFGVGLAATAAVTVLITRVARRELEKTRVAKKTS